MSLKVDLHCHTQESDGSLSCRALVERAAGEGINLLAITDHDTTAAFKEAAVIAKDLSIKLIPAVEISTVIENQELHIVGLGIDIENKALQSLLESNRLSRKERAEKILIKLQKSGLPDLTEQLKEVVTGDVVCRSHLAQLLCNEGIVNNFQKAFKSYLAKKKKAWVPVQWQAMGVVIEKIKAAGGVAILAHPSKYKLSNARLGIIIDAFVEAGGEALEIAYPGLNPSDRALLIRNIEKHQLAISQGSDFHHPGTSWTELGAFGVNPKSFRTIWQQFDVMNAQQSV